MLLFHGITIKMWQTSRIHFPVRKVYQRQLAKLKICPRDLLKIADTRCDSQEITKYVHYLLVPKKNIVLVSQRMQRKQRKQKKLSWLVNLGSTDLAEVAGIVQVQHTP